MPVAEPGAAFSPGSNNCNLVNAPRLTVMAGVVLAVLAGCVMSEAVTVALPAVLSVMLKLFVPATKAALAGKARYQAELDRSGFGQITTEIREAGPFYYAEDYHQQYLGKNPSGYCGLGGTGVSCPA